jgi:hypothetical protein
VGTATGILAAKAIGGRVYAVDEVAAAKSPQLPKTPAIGGISTRKRPAGEHKRRIMWPNG